MIDIENYLRAEKWPLNLLVLLSEDDKQAMGGLDLRFKQADECAQNIHLRRVLHGRLAKRADGPSEFDKTGRC